MFTENTLIQNKKKLKKKNFGLKQLFVHCSAERVHSLKQTKTSQRASLGLENISHGSLKLKKADVV